MKKSLFLCAMTFGALMFTIGGTAQTGEAVTSIWVEVAVEKQEIAAGPYARWAQKYLGISVPLADKVLYEIVSASVSDHSDDRTGPFSREATIERHMAPREGFPKLPVDILSNSAQSPEDAARAAAKRIFDIRKSRFELITGYVGENVFGGGLRSALDELDRLEQEYLSLFLGIQKTETIVQRYRIIPVRERASYDVCRFSTTVGLLPSSDAGGEPVVLELKPLGTNSIPRPGVVAKPSSKSSLVVIPDDVDCRVLFEGKQLGSAVVPLGQFGHAAYME